VAEVQTLVHAVEYAAANQLLHTPRGHLFDEPRHAQKESELKRAPHHRGERHQIAARRG
jgi:hypothetical protein